MTKDPLNGFTAKATVTIVKKICSCLCHLLLEAKIIKLNVNKSDGGDKVLDA